MTRNQLGELVSKKGKSVIQEWRYQNPGKALDLSLAQLSGSDLSGVDFSRANLEHANLSFCNLENCIFDGGNLFSTNLSATKLCGAQFHIVNLQQAKFRHAELGKFHFRPEQRVSASGIGTESLLVESARVAIFDRANLRLVEFSGAALNGVNFQDCQVDDANFTGAVLDAAQFINCSLTRTKFVDTQMVCARFIEGTLCETDFDRAYLFWTVFKDVGEISASVATATFSKESQKMYLDCLRVRAVRSIEQGREGSTFAVESPGEAQVEATGTHGHRSTVVELPARSITNNSGLTYGGPSRRPASD